MYIYLFKEWQNFSLKPKDFVDYGNRTQTIHNTYGHRTQSFFANLALLHVFSSIHFIK